MATERKQILPRLDPDVHDSQARWAGDELRSTNAQIKFLLRRALPDASRLPGQVRPQDGPGTPKRHRYDLSRQVPGQDSRSGHLPGLAAHRDDAASTKQLSKRCISRRPRNWTRVQITPVCAAAFSRVWGSVGARTAGVRAGRHSRSATLRDR